MAEVVLGVPAERLQQIPGLVNRADSALFAPKASFSGQEQYPDFDMKAAVLCARLVKNHPLPKGNKRTAVLCLIDFVERNGYELDLDPDETFDVLVGIATKEVSESDFATWLAERMRPR